MSALWRLWSRCLDAVHDRVQSLPLEGDITARVHKQILPNLAAAEGLPCLLVTLQGCQEEVLLNSTETDELVLPVWVGIIDRGKDWADATQTGRWLSWRQAISTAFLGRSPALPGVDECWKVETRSEGAIDRVRVSNQVGGVQVRCRCFTSRGTD